MKELNISKWMLLISVNQNQFKCDKRFFDSFILFFLLKFEFQSGKPDKQLKEPIFSDI